MLSYLIKYILVIKMEMNMKNNDTNTLIRPYYP